jgi:hypothetical protein
MGEEGREEGGLQGRMNVWDFTRGREGGEGGGIFTDEFELKPPPIAELLPP